LWLWILTLNRTDFDFLTSTFDLAKIPSLTLNSTFDLTKMCVTYSSLRTSTWSLDDLISVGSNSAQIDAEFWNIALRWSNKIYTIESTLIFRIKLLDGFKMSGFYQNYHKIYSKFRNILRWSHMIGSHWNKSPNWFRNMGLFSSMNHSS